ADGKTTRYYYDEEAKLMAEADVTGGAPTLTYVYIYDLSGQIWARQDKGTGALQYYQLNGHGDVVGLNDSEGNVLNSYSYDIWGGPLTAQETVPNVLRYSGEYWDDTTGLQYLRARWYDPGVGRFMGEDTYQGEVTDPLSLNLYTYVHNNPLIYSDPMGHKVVFNQNQFDYLNQLRSNGNGGQKKWAQQQLDDGMAYTETKTGLTVSGCFDCASEDFSPIYDVLGGVAGISKLAVKTAAKKVAKEVTQAAVKNSGQKLFWGKWSDYDKVNIEGKTFSIVGNRLYTRHAVDRMQPSGMKYTSETAGGKVGASRIISSESWDFGRSVSPQYVEDVIRSSKPIAQLNGTILYKSGSVEVYTNQAGAVITIITK
ncbi:RHS repeat-associated core domain-containing protein, partial [Paenibacillus medicaginis]